MISETAKVDVVFSSELVPEELPFIIKHPLSTLSPESASILMFSTPSSSRKKRPQEIKKTEARKRQTIKNKFWSFTCIFDNIWTNVVKVIIPKKA